MNAMQLHADAGSIIAFLLIFVALPLGICLMIWQKIQNKGVRRRLEATGFHADHFWAQFHEYLAVDKKNQKLAIKGGLRSAKGALTEGVFDYDQIKSVERCQPPDEFKLMIMVLAGDRQSQLKQFVVTFETPAHIHECLQVLSREKVPDPDGLDLAFDDR